MVDPPRSDGARPARPRTGGRRRRDDVDRQWRDLVGGGHTALTDTAAARVREIEPLTPTEVDEADRDLVIQRRNWKPES